MTVEETFAYMAANILRNGDRVTVYQLSPNDTNEYVGTIMGIAVAEVPQMYIIALDTPLAGLTHTYSCMTITASCIKELKQGTYYGTR